MSERVHILVLKKNLFMLSLWVNLTGSADDWLEMLDILSCQ